jgi:hypothetical protein
MKLNVAALGLAGGLMWGVVLFLFTMTTTATGYGLDFVNLVASVYPGFAVSYPGAFIGLVYGFVDGFVGFAVLAWLYNFFTGLVGKGKIDSDHI